MIYRVAEQHPERLWYLRNDVEDAIQSELWRHDDNLEAFEHMTALMVSVLTAFDPETKITIIFRPPKPMPLDG